MEADGCRKLAGRYIIFGSGSGSSSLGADLYGQRGSSAMVPTQQRIWQRT